MDAIDPDEAEEAVKILDRHVNQLMEHFESVQIFVSKHRPNKDSTLVVQRGDGNWFARYGQVRAWMVREEKDFDSERDGDEDDD